MAALLIGEEIVCFVLLAVFLPSIYLVVRVISKEGLWFSRDWRALWLVVGVMLIVGLLWFSYVEFEAYRAADELAEAYRVKAEVCWGMKRGFNYSDWNLTVPSVKPIWNRANAISPPP